MKASVILKERIRWQNVTFPFFFFVGLVRSASTSELSSIGGMVIIALCVIDQCLANMAGYWPRSFCVILNGGEVEVNKC